MLNVTIKYFFFFFYLEERGKFFMGYLHIKEKESIKDDRDIFYRLIKVFTETMAPDFGLRHWLVHCVLTNAWACATAAAALVIVLEAPAAGCRPSLVICIDHFYSSF